MTAALTFAALAFAHASLDIIVALIDFACRTRCARCRQVIEQ
ncbi:MAG TPA: hypothetical protein VKT99_15795 [Xanthobacteraceae bacterium]|jgi:hypothetical protein|nr:hypothetical protein [Xanthobacteraceae bacterium]